MANACPTSTTNSLPLFFLFCFLLFSHARCNQGHHGSISGTNFGEQYPHQTLPEEHKHLQENIKVLDKERLPKYARRMLIGSTAPICTYNECRGCRFKCTAEQVPVDANDPMNSAYHYKCVCHRGVSKYGVHVERREKNASI
uniref:Stomagen C-terminal domain-containing protein n=1 Tax=Oryza punctata TaxID=4537 RepID=A0A0E0JSP4_ORYPU